MPETTTPPGCEAAQALDNLPPTADPADEWLASLTPEARERELDHIATISQGRNDLNEKITVARARVHEALAALDFLCNDSVYDIEFAEGNGDLREQLDIARRALRFADLLRVEASR